MLYLGLSFITLSSYTALSFWFLCYSRTATPQPRTLKCFSITIRKCATIKVNVLVGLVGIIY